MDNVGTAIDISREALFMIVKTAAPLLISLFLAGLSISILQGATQLHDSSVNMIPKIVALILTLFLMIPWMLNTLVDYTGFIFQDMIRWFP